MVPFHDLEVFLSRFRPANISSAVRIPGFPQRPQQCAVRSTGPEPGTAGAGTQRRRNQAPSPGLSAMLLLPARGYFERRGLYGAQVWWDDQCFNRVHHEYAFHAYLLVHGIIMHYC